MTSATLTAGAPVDVPRLAEDQRGRIVRLGGASAAVGIAFAIAAGISDPHRFAFSYLVGFEYATTLALGALFLVIIQHLVRAGWSVGPRRQLEWLSSALPLCAVLFLPIAALSGQLYRSWMGAEALKDPGIAAKHAYLNPTFFFIRAAIYLAIWGALSWTFSRYSREQDASGDAQLTVKMQVRSAPAAALFGLSLTFSAFDWLMSLQPKWYSTIFGVYIFAGAVVSALAALALLTIALQRRGLIQSVSTVEHRHDIGKLLFGFTVFWAYIAFSQYFLIWYANIPEETIFFRLRSIGSWAGVSKALVMLMFVVPFVVLLSRTMKRLYAGLALGAVVILIGHYVDLYWLVMPNLDSSGAHFSWIDLGGLLGPLGVLGGWVAFRASRDNLYPIHDPRLAEAKLLDNP